MSYPDPKTIFESFAAVFGVVKRFSDTTWKSAVIELQNLLMGLQQQFMELQNELAESQRRVRDLEDQLAAKSADPKAGLVFERNVWWLGESRELSAEGPFCPTCMDSVKERRLLTRSHNQNPYATCRHCNGTFEAWPEAQVPPKAPPTQGAWLRGRPY